MEYDIIIGLEIHAELKTKSKMFCSCNNDSQNAKPNTNVCPICLGHPGTLPVPNLQAIEWVILTGLALNCQINQISKFDRKNYFYPDLPKGYQISQYDLPFCYQGQLSALGHNIEITRIHLEEDTGKLTHPKNAEGTIIDFNRAGTPLMEMVTEPTIPDAATAKAFCQRFQQILRYLDVSNADMEKGEMRCEANISVQEKDKWEYLGNSQIVAKKGHTLNPKTELKNLNSFKAVERGIEYEVKRQIEALENGETLIQETRGWNEDRAESFSQRTKETSADYRYFPEPDIPAIELSTEHIEQIKIYLVELPDAKIKRFEQEYGLEPETSEIIIADKQIADWLEQVISELRAWIEAQGDSWERQNKKLSKAAYNWLSSGLFKHLKTDNQSITDTKITPENFAELVTLVYQNKINSTAGQTILDTMYRQGGDPTDIMQTMGLQQMDNSDELSKIIDQIIKDNPTQTTDYKQGKQTLLQYFVGQTMAKTKGKANPKTVIEMLKEKLAQ